MTSRATPRRPRKRLLNQQVGRPTNVLAMSNVLPNLDDLLAALPDDGAGSDAAALARATAATKSWDEATQQVKALVQTWTAR